MTPQPKFTKYLHELKPLLEKDDDKSYNLFKIFETFKSKRINNVFASIKTKGLSTSNIFFHLIQMNILHFTVNQFTARYHSSEIGKKDTFYRMKNESGIDWRMIIYLLVGRFLYLLKTNQQEAIETPTCFICDDSTMSKRGKGIEGIGKVFDHKDHSYKLGFKGLFFSLWEGKSFIPLDFSLHSEKGKYPDKPFGLKKSEIARQSKKSRTADTPGIQRKDELTISKTIILIEMVKRAWKKGIHADYLLVDSWFVDDALISFVLKSSMYLLGMCKMDKRLYDFMDKKYNARQLLNRLKRTKAKRSRKINARYYDVIVNYKGKQIKLLFSRFNNQKDWSLLLTDNYKISFDKAVEIYQIRWSTEVFFKEAKQYLHLGKCQSADFDAQIADVSIVICAYLMLTLRRRFQAYEGLGKIFVDVQHELIEFTLWERIYGLFLELQVSILKKWNVDLELIMKNVIMDEAEQLFLLAILEQQTKNLNTVDLNNAA
jgi:hypothetical protein